MTTLVKLQYSDKTLSYCRGTARRAVSVEILSAAAQLYEKSPFKWPALGV